MKKLYSVGSMRAADAPTIAITARLGTRFRETWRQSWCPGTARSRENAKSIRDAEVTDAVRQKNCATQQMNSSTSAHVWPIDSDQMKTTALPTASSVP